ncbi:MAG: carbohydrate kinase [Burkholderiaceae bacterium]|jgi:fructokinase
MNPESLDRLPRFVALGEALTDLIRQRDRLWMAIPGGSCWNVARVVARLGIHSAFAGAISSDVFGDDLHRESADAGLDGRFLQRAQASPLLAVVSSSSPPRYFFIGENSADLRFDPAALPAGWREVLEIAHFGGISLAREPLLERLLSEALALHAAGKHIAFDPNFRSVMQNRSYDRVFRTLAPLASYLKVSEEDLEGLFPSLGARDALAHLRALAPQAAILLTRGAKGMTIFRENVIYEQAAFPVDVVDTVGCGDAAMGGWIASLLGGKQSDVASQARLAAAAAAVAATRMGPYAPTLEEVDGLLSS